jgi:hypothetical protein
MATAALVNPRSVYTWDPRALRYRGPSGAFVSQQAIKQALNTFVRRAQVEIQRLAREMTAGRIPIEEWQRQTANLVKSTHLANAAAAKGGWGQMTPADFGRVGQRLKLQYQHLRKFAKEAATGALTPENIERRAGMYARSAAGAFERSRFDTFQAMASAGIKVEMRNKLGKAEHCHTGKGRVGCAEESARGWVRLGDMTLPGERQCLSNCRCSVQYKVDGKRQ